MLLYVLMLTMFGLILLSTPALRQALLTRHLMARLAVRLPKLSRAEREALDSGDTGFEAELFSGKPGYHRLADLLTTGLLDDERAFLDRQVETLCAMLDDGRIAREQDLPAEVWSYLKREGFFGLTIPREYGGLGFSQAAHAAVLTTLATRSAAAAVTVLVPNALGPAELLLRYGTSAQKAHYLPLLARGEEIPCFALASPMAGLDAAAITDTGIVVRETFEGRDTLGFRISWSRRDIALAPVATLVGLVFRAVDPHRLLGGDAVPGITCALIARHHEGVQIGRRHLALHAAFMNGPIWGENVFVPIDWVIGGRAQVGQGSRMLTECLAAGHGVSLPSVGIATQMLALRTVGAYAALRHQCGQPIARFDGVADALGRMAACLYAQDGARRIVHHELDRGAKPAVSAALLKVHLTEGARRAVGHGMDILGGKGIGLGPRNFLAQAHQMSPIAITLDGAHILSRSQILLGPGAVRCHPFAWREWAALSDGNVAAFDAALGEHLTHVAANALRSLGILPPSEPPAHDERLTALWIDLHRLCARFALTADCALAAYGAGGSRRDLQWARLGEVLAHLYMAAGALLRWEVEGRREDEFELARLAAQSELHEAYLALDAFFRNAPWPLVLARWLALPTGVVVTPPTDQQWLAAARLVTAATSARACLTWGVYIPEGTAAGEPVAQLERALECSAELREIDQHLRGLKASHPGERETFLAGLPADKARFWREREALVADLIAVDDFAPEDRSTPVAPDARIDPPALESPGWPVAPA